LALFLTSFSRDEAEGPLGGHGRAILRIFSRIPILS
jgi:hypothetical protein